VPEDSDCAEFGKVKYWKDSSTEIIENSATNSTDEFDWDFILDREWSRTKK
jgi:hypothetical protein